MNDVARQFRDFFVSLKLTVWLLALGLVLVFFATLDQTNLGVWGIQQKWFRSFFVLQRFGDIPVPVFPGGYFIGGLLLINLISAHIYRFKFESRKLGIVLTHLGLILLLVGELLSGLWQEEFAMKIVEGETKNYAESYRHNELAIVDVTDPQTDEVVAIPERFIAASAPIQHPKLPFRVVTKVYYPNSNLRQRGQPNVPEPPVATTGGIGLNLVAVPDEITYKQDERNIPAAYVELVGAAGSIGTFLVYGDPRLPPQHFEHAGRSWKIALRFERAYYPFSLKLLDFAHDRYAGTDIPKNFSSLVHLQTPDGRDDRDVSIYMNNPLRYGGLTFYQADYDHEKDTYTVLQVVQNPSWLIPYIACSLMSLGLVLQFGIHLRAFVSKRTAARRPAAA